MVSSCPFLAVASGGLSRSRSWGVEPCPSASAPSSSDDDVKHHGHSHVLLSGGVDVEPVKSMECSPTATRPARRCPWWARALRFTAKFIAKQVAMRALKKGVAAAIAAQKVAAIEAS